MIVSKYLFVDALDLFFCAGCLSKLPCEIPANRGFHTDVFHSFATVMNYENVVGDFDPICFMYCRLTVP